MIGFGIDEVHNPFDFYKYKMVQEDLYLEFGEWYHVAVTFDTEKKVAVIYVDGREQSRIED